MSCALASWPAAIVHCPRARHSRGAQCGNRGGVAGRGRLYRLPGRRRGGAGALAGVADGGAPRLRRRRRSGRRAPLSLGSDIDLAGRDSRMQLPGRRCEIARHLQRPVQGAAGRAAAGAALRREPCNSPAAATASSSCAPASAVPGSCACTAPTVLEDVHAERQSLAYQAARAFAAGSNFFERVIKNEPATVAAARIAVRTADRCVTGMAKLIAAAALLRRVAASARP